MEYPIYTIRPLADTSGRFIVRVKTAPGQHMALATVFDVRLALKTGARLDLISRGLHTPSECDLRHRAHKLALASDAATRAAYARTIAKIYECGTGGRWSAEYRDGSGVGAGYPSELAAVAAILRRYAERGLPFVPTTGQLIGAETLPGVCALVSEPDPNAPVQVALYADPAQALRAAAEFAGRNATPDDPNADPGAWCYVVRAEWAGGAETPEPTPLQDLDSDVLALIKRIDAAYGPGVTGSPVRDTLDAVYDRWAES